MPDVVTIREVRSTAVSITVDFQPGWNGGLTQVFTIEYQEAGENDVHTINDIPNKNGLPVLWKIKGDNIKPDTSYTVRVWAKNTRGVSQKKERKVKTKGERL